MTTSGAMPTAKRVSQSALWSLKEALASIYWYKSDLESFLRATVSRPEVLVRLNFNEPKRGVVGALVDRLAADQDRYLGDLLELMREVTAFEDFAHLARLEDGTVKVARATEAVADLRKHYEGHAAVVAEREAAAERRRQAREGGARLQADRQKLNELKAAATELLTLDEQRRGYELEKLLRELFELFDLDPKASFKIAGEQIDGAPHLRRHRLPSRGALAEGARRAGRARRIRRQDPSQARKHARALHRGQRLLGDRRPQSLPPASDDDPDGRGRSLGRPRQQDAAARRPAS
jgi:hypothetical protein